MELLSASGAFNQMMMGMPGGMPGMGGMGGPPMGGPGMDGMGGAPMYPGLGGYF